MNTQPPTTIQNSLASAERAPIKSAVSADKLQFDTLVEKRQAGQREEWSPPPDPEEQDGNSRRTADFVARNFTNVPAGAGRTAVKLEDPNRDPDSIPLNRSKIRRSNLAASGTPDQPATAALLALNLDIAVAISQSQLPPSRSIQAEEQMQMADMRQTSLDLRATGDHRGIQPCDEVKRNELADTSGSAEFDSRSHIAVSVGKQTSHFAPTYKRFKEGADGIGASTVPSSVKLSARTKPSPAPEAVSCRNDSELPTQVFPGQTVSQQMAGTTGASLAERPESLAEKTMSSEMLGRWKTGAPVLRMLSLQLTPVHLGSVNIVLSRSGEELKVLINLEGGEALDSVEAGRQDIAQQLSAAGYIVNEIAVRQGGPLVMGATAAHTNLETATANAGYVQSDCNSWQGGTAGGKGGNRGSHQWQFIPDQQTGAATHRSTDSLDVLAQPTRRLSGRGSFTSV